MKVKFILDKLSLQLYNRLTMMQTARITDKRQITIPALIYRSLDLEKGDQLVVEKRGQTIILSPAENLVEQLAGSIKVSRHLKGKNIDLMIKKARENYFEGKYRG